MRKAQLALGTILVIAGTRVMLGIGLGIMLAEKLNKRQRHAVGWSLFLIGAGATVPLAMHVLGHSQSAESRLPSDREGA